MRRAADLASRSHREATADLAKKAFGYLELCCNERHSGYVLLILKSFDFRFKTSHYLTFL